jgi:hypothetical protein
MLLSCNELHDSLTVCIKLPYRHHMHRGMQDYVVAVPTLPVSGSWLQVVPTLAPPSTPLAPSALL